MKRYLLRFLAPSVVGLLVALALALHVSPRALADPSAGSTFTVTSVGDASDSNPGDGVCWTGVNYVVPECTLRAAVEEANANNNPGERDIIQFDIDGNNDAFTISPQSTIEITQPVDIYGYSQLGAVANTVVAPEPFNGTLKIIVSGADMPGTGTLLNVLGGGSDSIIRGLVINRNPGAGILINDGADNVQVYGNYFGSSANGMIAVPSTTPGGDMISIEGGATATHIGGTLPEQRNLISAQVSRPIYVGGPEAPSGGFIQGNYIGVGADGVTTLGFEESPMLDEGVNGYLVGGDSLSARNSIEYTPDSGIVLNDGSFNNQIVGNRILGTNREYFQEGGIATYGALDSVIRGNIIGQNSIGILLDGGGLNQGNYSEGLTIIGNNIGVLEDSATALPNRSGGILASKLNDSIIGGVDSADANIIAHNAGENAFSSAITVNNNSTNVAIIGNSIFDNNGLGIDFYGSGVTPNDDNDYDGGVNTMLNFPEGKYVEENGGDTTIHYRFNAPAGQYRIEFFSNDTADPSGYGEGQTLIDAQTITKVGEGYQDFSRTVAGTGYANLAFTATLIDANTPSGFGSTSEFGKMNNTLESDLSITKTLNNPEDLIAGGTLNYTVTITNNGYSDYDLADFDPDDENMFAKNLFVDILPPDLTFSSVVDNEDIECTPYGAGSASLTPFLNSHADYEVVGCAYVGPSHVLAEDESYSVTFSTTVNNDSDLTLENFVIVRMSEVDPDYAQMAASIDDSDVLDTLMNNNVNNVATTGLLRAESDLSITKTLDNPRDITPGATLNYTVKVTNNGPTSIDIRQFDGSGGNPLASDLFTDILPPDLTFGSVVGSNVSCTPYGPGSASLTPFFANHNDYELVLCAYVGPSHVLASGESYSTTFSTTVANDSDLSFDNFALSGLTASDPTAGDAYAAFGTPDAIDTLVGNNNNMAHTGTVTDLAISKEIVDASEPASSGTIRYKIKVTNNSGAPVDLNKFNDNLGPFVNYLFTDAMPPELTYTGITGDASCVGPVPVSVIGSQFANHADYNALVCAWSGGSYLLSRGESVEFVISATVAQPLPSTFTNYAMLGIFGSGGYSDRLTDPDAVAFFALPDLGNVEVIDANLDLVQSQGSNNIARTTYGDAPDNGGDNGGGGSNSGAGGSTGGLSGTGQNLLIIAGVVVVLLVGGAVLIVKSRKKKENPA